MKFCFSLSTLLFFLLLSSSNLHADSIRDFCRKFQPHSKKCVYNQKLTKGWLEDNDYVESIVTNCKNRFIVNDRVVTYVDYVKAYKCVKGNPNRWKSYKSTSKKFSSN